MSESPFSAEELPSGLDLTPAALAVFTTEHYNLQSQRSSTISETNGRASIFLGAVSAGLIGIGFSMQNGGSELGPLIFRFAVLGALAFLGWVTFLRTVQTSIDDVVFSNRIELIRDIYAQAVPQYAAHAAAIRVRDGYLVEAATKRSQRLVTVSGSIAMLTSILFAAAVGVAVEGASHALLASVGVALLLTVATMLILMSRQSKMWQRSGALPFQPNSRRGRADRSS